PELTVDTIVDGVDGVGGTLDLVGQAKRHVEHDVEGAPESAGAAVWIGHKEAMVGDTSSDERMGDLEQDGRVPDDQQHDLAVDLPGDAVKLALAVRRDMGATVQRALALPRSDC